MGKPDTGLIAIILCLLLIVAMLTGMVLLARSGSLNAFDDYSAVTEMAANIKKDFYYYDESAMTDEQIEENALRGIIAGLGDPYAEYMTQEEYDAMLKEDAGNYTGLGITVTAPDENGSMISSVYVGSPAEAAGILTGDRIVLVNGSPCANMEMADFMALFSTDDSVPDQLVILRNGERMTFTVRRGAVHVNRVYTELLEGNIAYVRLSEFSGTVAEELWAAIQAYESAGVDSLILDLRGNPGGGLTEVLNVAYHLIPKGELIATIKSKSGTERVYRSEGDARISNMEMAVLVNGDSASASELLAGALQAHHIATIVGTQTYGKGIVQSYLRLKSNGGWMKITTDAYFTPNDVCIQGTGITPDIPVEQPEEAATIPLEILDHQKDAQLQAAIRIFTSYTEKAA